MSANPTEPLARLLHYMMLCLLLNEKEEEILKYNTLSLRENEMKVMHKTSRAFS